MDQTSSRFELSSIAIATRSIGETFPHGLRPGMMIRTGNSSGAQAKAKKQHSAFSKERSGC